MFYAKQGEQHIFADSIPALLKKLALKPALNLDYLCEYLLYGIHFRAPNRQETLWKGIYQLPFGQSLCFNEGHTIDVSPKEAFQRTRDLFKEAVQTALRHTKNLGVELSGGLDSSSVAAMVRQCLPHQHITAFSHGVPACHRKELPKEHQGQCDDESPFSLSVSRHLHLNQVMINDGFDFASTIETCAKILGTFSEVLFPILNYRCYEFAKERQIDTLFSGFGGDELISIHGKLYLEELKQQRKFWPFYYEAVCSGRIQAKLKRFFQRPPPPHTQPFRFFKKLARMGRSQKKLSQHSISL